MAVASTSVPGVTGCGRIIRKPLRIIARGEDVPEEWAAFVFRVLELRQASVHTYIDVLRTIALDFDHRRQVDAIRLLFSIDKTFYFSYC